MASRLTADKTIPFGSVGAVDWKTRTFEGWSSILDIDRDGEYVPLSAFEKRLPAYLANNPVLLLGHQHKTTLDSLPIGKCIDAKFMDDRFWTKFYVTRRSIGDDILVLLDEGILKGLSAGFIPLDFIPNPADHQLPTFLRGKGLKKYYKEVELVEISLLSIPSNRQSLVIAAEKGNRVANMVMKSWQGDDVSMVIKAWLSEKDGEDPHKKHLWLGFSLQPEAREALSEIKVEGDKIPEKDLHLTLRYFGDVEKMGDVDGLRDALLPLENTLAPTYNLTPIDFEIFNDVCLVARYRNEAISELHQKVNSLLEHSTIKFPEEFPHLDSHVTLSQGSELTPPIDKPPLAQTGKLQLRWGKDEIIHEFTPHRVAWETFVSKLWDWNESEHPRDPDGEFASKLGGGVTDTPARSWLLPTQNETRHEEINKKLDAVLSRSDRIQQGVNDIQDEFSWKSWARGWIMKIGALAGVYYGIKHVIRSPEAKAKIRQWIVDVAKSKAFVQEEMIDKLLAVMTLTKAALDKAEQIGASETPEYKKLKAFYDRGLNVLKNFVSFDKKNETPIPKGLSQLWVKKEFKEEEHPRNADGEFRNKSEGPTAKKAKAEHVDEGHEIPDKSRIQAAMEHPDEPGAGAAKRRELKLSSEETFEAVMAEFKRGTLRSGNGKTVTNPKQAKVIAISEKKKTEERVAEEETRKKIRQAARKAAAKAREESRAKFDTLLAATALLAIGILGTRSIARGLAEDAARTARMREAREGFRRAHADWQAHSASQKAKTDKEFDRIFEELKRKAEEARKRAEERAKTRAEGTRGGWSYEEGNARYRQQRQHYQQEWDDFFKDFFGGNRSNGGARRAQSYNNFETGPTLKKGVSKIWDKMQPIRDIAKLIIDQLKNKKLYEEAPVPKDAMVAHDALKMLNAKLKNEIGKTPGVEAVHADTEKTLAELKRLIEENWKKHNVKEGMAAKDFDGIATKEWTAEEEAEHPRAPAGSERGGEFVSKNEPNPDTGAWGGVRKNAGRTAKNPVVAAQKLQERFKQENPQITDEEVKQKMIDHAVEKRNGDLYLYLTDPVGFQKKQEQDIIEAMASKPGKQKVGKNTADKIDDSKETNAVYNDIKTSKAQWNREIQQASDMRDAYKTWTASEKPEEMDVAKAKLTTAAAAIATVIGLGLLIARKPDIVKAGFKKALGADYGPVSAAQSDLAHDAATYFRWLRSQDISLGEEKYFHPAQEDYFKNVVRERQIGAFRNLFSKSAEKLDAETKELLFGSVEGAKGKKVYLALGPKLTGYLPGSKWARGTYRHINGMERDFQIKPGDVHMPTGVPLATPTNKFRDAQGKIKSNAFETDLRDFAIAHGIIPKNPEDWGKGKWTKDAYRTVGGKKDVLSMPNGLEIGTSGDKKIWVYKEDIPQKQRTIVTEYIQTPEGEKVVSNLEGVTPEAAAKPKETPKKGKKEQPKQQKKTEKVDKKEADKSFATWLRGKTTETGIAPLSKEGQVRFWPKDIGRVRTDEEIKKYNEAAQNYKNYNRYFLKEILPKLSGRTIGMLSVASGVAGAAEGAYYFQNDIENFIGRHLKQKEETEKVAADVSRPTKEGNKTAGELKLQIQAINAQRKLEEATQKRDYQKDTLARSRDDFAKRLTQLGIRRWDEGAVPNWAMDGQTILRRFGDAGVFDDPLLAARAHDIMFGKSNSAKYAFLNEVDQMGVKPLTEKYWQEFEENYKQGENPSPSPKNESKPSDASSGWEYANPNPGKIRVAGIDKNKNPFETWIDENHPDITDKQRREFEKWMRDNGHTKSKTKTAGFGGLDLITKMFEPDKEEPKPKTKDEAIDEVITLMAAELAKMISDISQSCKTVVESGMPGSAGYGTLNDIVTEIYGYLKDHAKKNTSEKVETKGLDNVMSSQSDSGGGLFAEARRCRVCGRPVTEKLLLQCKKSGCPASYLEKIENKVSV